MQANRNNLDKSSSPYLLQHVNNPIWWQEWSSDIINHAVEEDKPLFVSVGYSTCHWCHVMASEAFSDQETANYLNYHFVCIKVDREQRMDIDQFLMDFINRQNGSGGWPLNVFLTTDLRPVYALTYAPAKPVNSVLSFLSISQKIYDFISKNKDSIPQFNPGIFYPSASHADDLVDLIFRNFDRENGGFGRGQKFPSHSTLLYLLYLLSTEENYTAREICTKTLDAMIFRGLNDHLQGGIFRYCVDPQWTIPHFEKMLYDQAMALWVFSLAYRLIGNPLYKSMAENILRCLDESFEDGGVYISAHDADTGHEEGATYLWSLDELESSLTADEFLRFSETYDIESNGNFEGRNHLIRNNDTKLKDIEDKLLAIRKSRNQPSRDEKIQCGINALTAISLIQAGRNLDRIDLEEKAASLIKILFETFWDGKTLGHSSFKGVIQRQGFLSDAATMLTAISMLYENDPSWKERMTITTTYINTFKEGDDWFESKVDDFHPVSASMFDHPFPSGLSFFRMGITRAMILSGCLISPMEYRQPLQADFCNIAAMISNGLFHVYTTKEFIPWNQLPPNSLQKRGEPEDHCYKGVCRPYN